MFSSQLRFFTLRQILTDILGTEIHPAPQPLPQTVMESILQTRLLSNSATTASYSISSI